ncbi:MAG: response regulator [Pseudanabaena sp.]|nr:MAG: response regulator [Pseudanabaena sp.]
MENTASKTILLIEDEEYVCQIVQTSLEVFSNWQIATARSGKEGLAASATVKPDAIVLDIMMPNMDGFDVLKELQADQQLANIPVVLLTSRIDLTEPQEISRLGVKGTIAKPFYVLSLVNQISNLLGW